MNIQDENEGLIKVKQCLLWEQKKSISDCEWELHSILKLNNSELGNPIRIRELITSIFGEKPSIELFSDNPSAGWDVWMPD